MRTLPHTHSCFVCGDSNLVGLWLRFVADGNIVRTEFTPGPDHVGFKNLVHGGIVATLLDEIMVWACAVSTRQFAYCAELTVRFRHPLRPGQKIMATGELLVNRRGRIFEPRAELRDSSGILIASGTGRYIPISASEAAEFGAELVGPWPIEAQE